MRKADRRIAFLFILPTLLAIGGIVLFPIAYEIMLSFTNKHALERTFDFVGLKNYLTLFNRRDFWDALYVGVLFSGGSLSLQFLVGLVVALVLNKDFVVKGVIRGLTLVPYMVPTVVVAALWKWMYNDMYGVFNYVFLELGIIKAPVAWLAGKSTALLSVIAANVWQYFPFISITLLARLTTISPELYEAASIDGATSWQKFIHITLPQLMGVILIVILLRFFWQFRKFDAVWLYTQGGPLRSTEHIPILLYRIGFAQMKQGVSACVATVMLVFLSIFTYLYLRFARPLEQR